MKSYFSIPKEIRHEFIDLFHNEVRSSITKMGGPFEILDTGTHTFSSHNSIVSFFLNRGNGSGNVSFNDLRKIYYYFLNYNDEFHIPQPTKLLKKQMIPESSDCL